MKAKKEKDTSDKPKMVIFEHAGAVFGLSEKIREDTTIIKNFLKENKEELIKYYENIIKKTAQGGKCYILVKYHPVIAECFESHLHNGERDTLKNWKFITFFNDDNKFKKIGKKNPKKYKEGFMRIMERHEYILKVTIPYGHIITEEDLTAIEFFWEAPSRAKSINDLKKQKPRYPICTYPVGGALAPQRTKRLKELLV